MIDPIEGRFGQVILSGWIAETPDTGQDGAFMLAMTSDKRARTTMPLVAEALGIDPRPAQMTTSPKADTWVEIGGDGWAHLHVPGGEKFSRPVTAEWADLARRHARVVLVVGYEPSTPERDAEEYMDHALSSGQFAFGLVPVR